MGGGDALEHLEPQAVKDLLHLAPDLTDVGLGGGFGADGLEPLLDRLDAGDVVRHLRRGEGEARLGVSTVAWARVKHPTKAVEGEERRWKGAGRDRLRPEVQAW